MSRVKPATWHKVRPNARGEFVLGSDDRAVDGGTRGLGLGFGTAGGGGGGGGGADQVRGQGQDQDQVGNDRTDVLNLFSMLTNPTNPLNSTLNPPTPAPMRKEGRVRASADLGEFDVGSFGSGMDRSRRRQPSPEPVRSQHIHPERDGDAHVRHIDHRDHHRARARARPHHSPHDESRFIQSASGPLPLAMYQSPIRSANQHAGMRNAPPPGRDFVQTRAQAPAPSWDYSFQPTAEPAHAHAPVLAPGYAACVRDKLQELVVNIHRLLAVSTDGSGLGLQSVVSMRSACGSQSQADRHHYRRANSRSSVLFGHASSSSSSSSSSSPESADAAQFSLVLSADKMAQMRIVVDELKDSMRACLDDVRHQTLNLRELTPELTGMAPAADAIQAWGDSVHDRMSTLDSDVAKAADLITDAVRAANDEHADVTRAHAQLASAMRDMFSQADRTMAGRRRSIDPSVERVMRDSIAAWEAIRRHIREVVSPAASFPLSFPSSFLPLAGTGAGTGAGAGTGTGAGDSDAAVVAMASDVDTGVDALREPFARSLEEYADAYADLGIRVGAMLSRLAAFPNPTPPSSSASTAAAVTTPTPSPTPTPTSTGLSHGSGNGDIASSIAPREMLVRSRMDDLRREMQSVVRAIAREPAPASPDARPPAPAERLLQIEAEMEKLRSHLQTLQTLQPLQTAGPGAGGIGAAAGGAIPRTAGTFAHQHHHDGRRQDAAVAKALSDARDVFMEASTTCSAAAAPLLRDRADLISGTMSALARCGQERSQQHSLANAAAADRVRSLAAEMERSMSWCNDKVELDTRSMTVGVGNCTSRIYGDAERHTQNEPDAFYQQDHATPHPAAEDSARAAGDIINYVQSEATRFLQSWKAFLGARVDVFCMSTTAGAMRMCMETQAGHVAVESTFAEWRAQLQAGAKT